MKTYAVWCEEYPDDGSVLVDSWSEKGARRRFRRATTGRGNYSDTPLGVCEMTPDMLKKREEMNP